MWQWHKHNEHAQYSFTVCVRHKKKHREKKPQAANEWCVKCVTNHTSGFKHRPINNDAEEMFTPSLCRHFNQPTYSQI